MKNHSRKFAARAAAAITSNTTTNTSSFTKEELASNLIACITVSARTDGTFTVQLQHSSDGTNWLALGSASSNLSANGIQTSTIASSTPTMPFIRASVVSTSVTSGATVAVDIYY